MSVNGPGDPPNPGGSAKKTGIALQLKLPCATLDDVRSRHPELASRRFFLKTGNPRPVDTAIRISAVLSDGKHCFRANAVVEKVYKGGETPERSEAGMMLWLLRMDDPGRELVAWMGGQPPPLLKPAAPEAAPPPAPSQTPPSPAPTSTLVDFVVTPPPTEPPPLPVPAATAAPPRPAPAAPPKAAPPPLDPPEPAPTPWSEPVVAAPPSWEDAAPPQAPAWEEPSPPAAQAAPLPAHDEPAPPSWEDAVPPQAEPVVAAAPPQAPAQPSWEPPPPAAPPSPPAPAPRSAAPATPPAAAAETAVEEDFEVAIEDEAPPAVAPVAAPAAPRVPSAPPGKPAPPKPESRRPSPPPLPRPTLAPGAATPKAPSAQQAEEAEETVPARAGAPSGPIIGIDLGTTNSCAAVVKDGKPFVIPSREGYNTIPSVVALSDKGKLMVGHPARSQLLINPRNTVYGAKRLIGRQYKSPVVTDLLGRFSYEIVAGPRGEAAVKMGEQIFSLQKISSLVLAEVKELAERWLGSAISRAVITVPAYYNDNQRQAVRAAGALAGLDVERIVNEPTAAAIAFAQGRSLEQRVMVYDLGGGTFDTSVLELHGNVYEVISTGGDTFLGGVDFDKAVVQDLLTRFKQKHKIDFEGDRVALQRITDAAERAKISLSERLTTQVNVPFVAMVGEKGYNLDETLSRTELEKLTTDLVERTLRVCDDVLTNCGLKPPDIGEVLLVGGQSRMPLVRAKLREFFGKEPSKAVHPDEAVALGAALLAHSMQSGDIGGMVLVDVLPMSIGVGLPGGRFKKVVERNTSLPHKKTYSIWTSQDDQKTLEIPIFQGEAEKAQQNEYLGTLVVPDLPPGTKGNVVFDIIFSLSAESLLSVTAEERGTRRTVTATFSTQDSAEAVKRRMSGAGAAEPPRLDAPEPGGKGGWMSRLFGR
ncbi:MAG TPA: Hsp70 family protein [Myxococcales bacterium]|nr:Hsp70 family protein [Myxococcales bacterium]